MRALATTVAVIASLAVSGCGSSHPTPTTRASSGGGTPTTDIARNLINWTQVARASNRHFSIFPALPGKTHCAIPAGGVHLKPLVLHGTCQTSVRRRPTQEPSLSVTFTETWRRAACAPDLDVACSHPLARHTWEVIEGETIVTSGTKPRIYATRSSGATAPQDYK